ncbi:MAG: flagellar hook-associated protein FlgK [Acidobacteriota bacterium]
MGTINSAFHLISGALDADQQALSVIANNVANVNTPGYTRETPNWQENAPVVINGVAVGTGVTETGATSQRDRVLEERLDQQQQLSSASGTRLTALNSLQALFTPASGTSSTAGNIGADITSFFNSFSSLEANPTENAMREQVLSSASTLAGDISGAAQSVDAQRASLDQEASGVASQVNSLTGAIAQLNQQIQSAAPNSDGGILEDQRQQDLSQLSQLIGINQVTTENNGLSVTTASGQLLVSQGQSFQLTTGVVNGMTNFYVNGQNIVPGSGPESVGGQLGGYLTARDVDLPAALQGLDQLAYGLSTTVNAQNQAGADLAGHSGTPSNPSPDIFAQPAQVAGSAASMAVVMTDPKQIAAAGANGGSGDNSNALAMANLAGSSLIASSATTAFSMTQNLSSTAPVGNTVTGTTTVYDAAGKSYQANVTYTNLGGGQWNYQASLADVLTPDTSVAGQVRYSFGAGETVDPGTNLTITGLTAAGTPATMVAPAVMTGEPVGDAASGYVQALNTQLAAAGITGVTVSNTGGVLTIAGATSTQGNVVANPVATGASGTLTFNAAGVLQSPAADVTGIGFSGFSDGAAPVSLAWNLYGAGGAAQITQTAAASAQTAESHDGTAGISESPTDFYSNFVTTLGATVAQAQTENTAQSASVTQLQTQRNALSSVNLNDEASALALLETSYQAASQVFTILNTVVSSALNLGVETAVA